MINQVKSIAWIRATQLVPRRKTGEQSNVKRVLGARLDLKGNGRLKSEKGARKNSKFILLMQCHSKPVIPEGAIDVHSTK